MKPRAGEPQVGTVISVADASLAESVARSFDLVWIDLEHGALGLHEMQAVAIALQGAGCRTLVRVPGHDWDRLSAVLDVGVDGVVFPMVESREAAENAVAATRYPPAGSRGFGPRRAGHYGRVPQWWASPDATIDCLLQIETRQAVAAVDEIASVEGLAGLAIGTADLSLSLGVPGDLEAPPMREALAEVASSAEAAGIPFVIAGGGNPQRLIRTGCGRAQAIVYSVDLRLYAAALDSAAKEVREALRSADPQSPVAAIDAQGGE